MLLPYTFLLCFSQYSCFSVAGREIILLDTNITYWPTRPICCSVVEFAPAFMQQLWPKASSTACSHRKGAPACAEPVPLSLWAPSTTAATWSCPQALNQALAKPSLPGRVCSSLEINAKGSQASDWAVSGLLAASTSKGLSSAVIMNSKSRPFGPRGKIQRFLLRVWFIPLTLLGNSFSVLFQAKFPLSSTGDWADSTTWIFGP